MISPIKCMIIWFFSLRKMRYLYCILTYTIHDHLISMCILFQRWNYLGLVKNQLNFCSWGKIKRQYTSSWGKQILSKWRKLIVNIHIQIHLWFSTFTVGKMMYKLRTSIIISNKLLKQIYPGISSFYVHPWMGYRIQHVH